MAVIGIATVIGAAALFGFIVMPLAQPNLSSLGPLAAICRAVGLRSETPAAARHVELQAPPTVSQVAWTTSTLAAIAGGDPQKGRDIAQQCTPCHGEHGIVPEAQAPDVAPAVIPNLAQLDRAALFKQMSDYRSGSRKSEIMAPMAQALSDQDMVDVIAYVAAPSGNKAGLLPNFSTPGESIAGLVDRGSSGRGVPACISCHAVGAGGPIGAPVLTGQRAAYLEQQLKFFRSGERSNDVYGPMREITGKLTDMEIAGIAKYYAAMR